MSVGRVQEPVVVGVFAGLLLLLSLLPFLVMGGDLFTTAPSLGGAPWALLLSTLGLALAVTVLAALIGVPLGVLLGKTDVRGRQLALLVHAFPLFLPPFLVALGWLRLLGRQGLLGSELSSSLLFGPVGVVGVLGLCLAPVVTWMTALGLRGVPPSLEEAARLVARPRRALLHILLPLAWPSVAFGALVVFALALTEIGVPMFLHVRTWPSVVFTRLGGVRYAPGEALVMALPLVAVALLLLWLERRVIGRRSFSALALRAPGGQVFALGRLRGPVTAGVWLLCGVFLAPVVVLAAGADLAQAGRWIGDSLANSVIFAASAATLLTAMGVVLGHRLAGGRRGSGLLDAVAMLAFVTPSAVLGVGLVETWNRAGTQLVYTSAAIMVIGLSARYAVVAERTVAAVLTRSSPHFEQSAASVGAGYLRRLLGIVVPMNVRGIGAAWLLTLVFCLRDLDTVAAFYPPGLETLPIRIYTLEANGSAAVLDALATTHAALTAVALGLGALLLWRRP